MTTSTDEITSRPTLTSSPPDKSKAASASPANNVGQQEGHSANNNLAPAMKINTTRNGTANSTPSPSKLRRKVSVEDALDNIASVQRLVEYFVIVSCLPRWEVKNPTTPKGPTSTPEPKRKEPSKNGKSSIVTSTTEHGHALPPSPQNSTIKKKFSRSFDDVFRKREKTSTDYGLEASLSHDSLQTSETHDEVLPPPKPRGTWHREEQDSTEGNIHMPADANDEYTFQPKITSRYPQQDHQGSPLNPMVTQFCYPVSDVVVPIKEYQMPRVHHFVLTNDKGRKIYGTCLTIYEEYHPPPDAPWRVQNLVHSDSGERDIEVTMDTEQSTLFLPRCLCILSIWPYMTAFREYLAQLYRLATSTDCMSAPIERYILNICMEIPAPPPGAFEVQINILDSVIRFWSPPAKLPIAYVALNYQILFDCLDVENILHLWYCLTLERKVLLVSSQYSVLTVCSEILCSLLYPMKWSHLYVPLLPRFLCPMLDAPVPYLCGVTRDSWLHVQQFVSDETIVVDLDRNSVMFGEQTPVLPALPGKKWMKLQTSLEDIAGHLFWQTRGLETEYKQFIDLKLNRWGFKRAARQKGEKRWNEKLITFDQAFNLQFTPDSETLRNEQSIELAQNQWDRVQEAFLRLFVALLKDYRKFLHTPDSSTPTSPPPGSSDWVQWSKRRYFDVNGFVNSEKREYKPYLSELTKTQQFDDFITKRLYSPDVPDLIFFDQSIDAKLNRSRLKLKKVETPFLQSAKTHKVLKPFLAVAPNTENLLHEGPYMYKTWPETLNTNLFGSPRPIPTIITAEFDRQAALISRLRTNHNLETTDDSRLLDFYRSDYDESPHGMAFTVFFYAYSAIIGREWEAYQQKQRELEAAVQQATNEDCKESANLERIPISGTEGTSSNLEVVMSESEQLLSDISLGLCDACPDPSKAVDDAIVYLTTSPCPEQVDELTLHAQQALDTISKLTSAPFDQLQQRRSGSLLDDDEGFAEYEEAREVAVAQLDLAFDTLKTMEMRGLFGDPDAYKSLMEACGRCGDKKRALELIEMMKRDGLVADKEILSCFIAAFAHHKDTFDELSGGNPSLARRGSDAYSTFLKRKLEVVSHDSNGGTILTGPLSESEAESSASDASSSGSEPSVAPFALKPAAFFSWLAPHRSQGVKKKRRRRRKREKSAAGMKPATDRLVKQLVLGESLLDFLYPDLKIDTDGDVCPQCSHHMLESEIIAGWQPCDFQELTTRCPRCQHRFVPRFSVSCSAPTFEGSQGPSTPLYCEFLSPWVLRKELSHVIESVKGVDALIDPGWRSGTEIGATLWWNLITMFKRHELPFSFLLQGSFQNRLINPVPQD